MANTDIRRQIAEAGLKQWEVADAIGVNEATLCVWLRKPLANERLERVRAAIEKLKRERGSDHANAETA